jgi:zinc/manganese transport system permease protein
MSGVFTWNLWNDLRDMWSLPAMVSAFRAGTIVAVLAGLVGWFMVLRRQSFAGHTLSLAGFPGAAAGVLTGIGATAGYLGFALAAALVFGLLPAGRGRGYREESAAVGTVQAFALATGLLFVALYHGYLGGTSAMLFGTVLGITPGQVTVVAVIAVGVLAVLGLIGRPLLFTSIDGDVARAHGVPTKMLDVVFLLLLGATTAEISQITGALLVIALLVLPAATAQVLAARPAVSLALSVLFSVCTVWAALFIGFYSAYPIGFWLTTVAFAGWVLAQSLSRVAIRVPA